jgi:hypothetical protein
LEIGLDLKLPTIETIKQFVVEQKQDLISKSSIQNTTPDNKSKNKMKI